MKRWSLRNYLQDISYAQFIRLTAEFRAAGERVFGTPCSCTICLLNQLRMSVSIPEFGMGDFCATQNKKATFFTTDRVENVTPDHWKQARQVVVRIDPVDKAAAPDFAFGQVEFKGQLPRYASFYIQGGENCRAAEADLCTRNSRMLKGDGYSHHGAHSLH